MKFSFLKKIFYSKNNKKIDKTTNTKEIERDSIARKISFERVVSDIDQIKSTLTEILASGRGLLDCQQFDKELICLMKYLEHDEHLRENVKNIYSEDQLLSYDRIVNELSQTCLELSSQLKNMRFFKERNLLVAKMITEINQSSKQLEEKKKQVTVDVELALKQHREYKWSILKTSNNKQKLKQFLDEIIAEKKAVQRMQTQSTRIVGKWRETRGDRTGGDVATMIRDRVEDDGPWIVEAPDRWSVATRDTDPCVLPAVVVRSSPPPGPAAADARDAMAGTGSPSYRLADNYDECW